MYGENVALCKPHVINDRNLIQNVRNGAHACETAKFIAVLKYDVKK